MSEAPDAVVEARRSIVAAGTRLLHEGLVARTWGNISLRIDERRFAITPSGIPYADLREDMIALVDTLTGEWSGTRKPSGERGLHRAIYEARPDVNAIVHTHQNAASACAASRAAVPAPWGAAPCAPYAPPGTKALAKATAAALGDGPAALLANHGAVAVARDLDGAFDVAIRLEEAAADFLLERAEGRLPARPDAPWSGADVTAVSLADGSSALLSSAPYTMAWAEREKPLLATLDDLAQIVGRTVPATKRWPVRATRAEAIFVTGRGLLSRGADAEAIAMVVEKAARAELCGEANGKAVRLPFLEAALMRLVYKRSYAKQATRA